MTNKIIWWIPISTKAIKSSRKRRKAQFLKKKNSSLIFCPQIIKVSKVWYSCPKRIRQPAEPVRKAKLPENVPWYLVSIVSQSKAFRLLKITTLCLEGSPFSRSWTNGDNYWWIHKNLEMSQKCHIEFISKI